MRRGRPEARAPRRHVREAELRRLVLQEVSAAAIMQARLEAEIDGRDRNRAAGGTWRRSSADPEVQRRSSSARQMELKARRGQPRGRGAGAAQGDRRPRGKHPRLSGAGAVDRSSAWRCSPRSSKDKNIAAGAAARRASRRCWRCSAPRPAWRASSANCLGPHRRLQGADRARRAADRAAALGRGAEGDQGAARDRDRARRRAGADPGRARRGRARRRACAGARHRGQAATTTPPAASWRRAPSSSSCCRSTTSSIIEARIKPERHLARARQARTRWSGCRRSTSA